MSGVRGCPDDAEHFSREFDARGNHRKGFPMSRHDVVIIKDTHRGLLYEDGIFRHVLPAGRYQVLRQPSPLASLFAARVPRAEIVLVDVRGRDRTVLVQDFLTADGATISASFTIQYRVVDPHAALHEVKNFEERAYSETQAAARRALRGMSLEEILGSRDEIGEELLRQVAGSAAAYGLEVSGLDFKDLVVPPEFRATMNRAVLAKRLRQARPAGAGSLPAGDRDDAGRPLAPDLDGEADEDPDLIHARGSFGEDRPTPPLPDHLTIRRPDGNKPAAQMFQVRGFDPALRRYRP